MRSGGLFWCQIHCSNLKPRRDFGSGENRIKFAVVTIFVSYLVEIDFYFDYSYQTTEAKVVNDKMQGRTIEKKGCKVMEGTCWAGDITWFQKKNYNYLNKLILCKIKILYILFYRRDRFSETGNFRPMSIVTLTLIAFI